MRRRGFQLSRPQRFGLYGVSVVLLLSGAAWAWVHRLEDAGQASRALREFRPWLIETHGYAALGFVLLLGTLLATHVRRSWHAGKNRTVGLIFLIAVCLLTLSGYMLYYLGNEQWRNSTSQFHLGLGLVMPILWIWHVRSGRRATRLSVARTPSASS